MTYRVIQWATGTVGIHAVPGIVAHPDLELVGLWVHSDAKAGQDAGALCGVDDTGVIATQDADALLALDADVVCYTANSDLRPHAVVDDICRILESGKNVVSSSFVPLLFPQWAGEGIFERLQTAGETGGATVYTSGIDPGFGNASLAVQAAGLCKEVRSIRMAEIVNYATWDNPFTLFDIMAFGKAEPTDGLLLSPGSTALAWGPVIAMVAEGIGLKLQRLEEFHEVIRADRPIDIVSGRIETGTISGMRFEIRGFVDDGDDPRIVVEHVTRMRDEDAPDWPQGQGYRINITGEPHVKLELELSSDHGDHNHAGCLATAMYILNAIPAVVAAAPGVATTLTLPVYSAHAV